MRFLADESCDFLIVRVLRDNGHDVTAISEISPRLPDAKVLELAFSERRILITEDKDFGQLVYSHRQVSQGVIFLRYAPPLRSNIAQETLRLVERFGEKLFRCYTVIQPGKIRIQRSV